MLKKPAILVVISLVLIGCSNLHPMPPAAVKRAHLTRVHDVALADDYYWLREKESPAVLAHLRAENAYTKSVLSPTRKLQKQLYAEFISRLQEDDEDVPYRKDSWLYFGQTEKGKNYKKYCRKPLAGGDEQVMLDLNRFEKDHEFVGRGAMEVSDDAKLLAYTIDFTGFREYALYLKDLSTGETKLISDQRVNGVEWAADNRTLIYVVEDESHRPNQVFRQDIITGERALIYEETDRAFNIGIGRSRSGKYIVIYSASSTTSDARVIPADAPKSAPVLLAPRVDGQEYYPEDAGNEWFIRVNDTGRNFRLVDAPHGSTDRNNWRELIPHRNDVMIEDLNCFAGYAVLSERTNGLPRLTVRDAARGATRVIPMSESIYNVATSNNEMFDAPCVRYMYESPITPISTFDYDFKTGESTLLKRQPTPNYDPNLYEVQQLFAIAKDGAKIPISIVRKKNLGPGPHPVMLYAYGAYGASETDDFVATRMSLLDRGVIVATAHIRGGGEMGKIWHEQGRLMNKLNTFTDFIAAAEHLIKENITSPQKLAISGYSAGGLTMGAVLNMRPDLFKCAIVGVPFVDVMNTMLDDSLPLTTQEYLEWGNPNDKAAFDYMRAYSPYDNIAAKDYPAMLVLTSLNDSQVMYWEPAKYVAKLRATKTDTNPLLFHCVMQGGHGGPSGRYDDLKEEAMVYAFVLWQLGV